MTNAAGSQDTAKELSPEIKHSPNAPRRWFARPVTFTAAGALVVFLSAAAIYLVHDSQLHDQARQAVAQYQAEIAENVRDFDAAGTSNDRFRLWASLDLLDGRSDAEDNKYVTEDAGLRASLDEARASFQSSFDAYYTGVYDSQIKNIFPVEGDTDYKAQIAALSAAIVTVDGMIAEQDTNKTLLDVEALKANQDFLAGRRALLADAVTAATASLQTVIDATIAGYEATIAGNTVEGTVAATYRAAIRALEELKGAVSVNADLVGAEPTNGYLARIDLLISGYSATAEELDTAQAAADAAAAKAMASASAGPAKASSSTGTSSPSSAGSGTKWVIGADGVRRDATVYCEEWLECTLDHQVGWHP